MKRKKKKTSNQLHLSLKPFAETLLVGVFLITGFPFSFSPDFSLVYLALITYVGMLTFKNYIPGLSIIASIIAASVYAYLVHLSLAYTLLGIGVGFMFALLLKPLAKPFAQIIPLVLTLFLASLMHGGQIREYLNTEPTPNNYHTDTAIMLKSYYQIKQHGNYYQAFYDAQDGHRYLREPFKDLWSWRLPTVFYIWNIPFFTSGSFIFWLFVSLVTASLALSYDLMRKLLPENQKNLALLSPYLLLPYFLGALNKDNWTMLNIEWWGMFAFLFGVYFLVKKKDKSALVSMLLAVFVRELMIIPVMATLIIYFMVYRCMPRKLMTIPVLYIGLLLLHLFMIRQTVPDPIPIPQMVTPRLGADRDGGLNLVMKTLRFETGGYYFSSYPIVLVLGLLGLAGIYSAKRQNKEALFLLAPYSLPLSFFIIGGHYNNYWGLMYGALIVFTGPLVLSCIKQLQESP